MLRMTKQADYGIVLLSHMATRSLETGIDATELRFAAPELSEATGLPLPTVSKILKLLSRQDVLNSHRGVKGGYSLANRPENVSVVRMIEALDGPIAFTECVEESPGHCSQEATCKIRDNWQLINTAVRTALKQISLSDLMRSQPDQLVQLTVGGQPIVKEGLTDSAGEGLQS